MNSHKLGNKIHRLAELLPYLIICIIIVCSFLSAYGMCFLGDDLNHGIRTHTKFPNWYQWPLIIPYQWLTSNGRFGDMLGNFLLAESPMWLFALLSGLIEGLLYLMVMKLSFPNRKIVFPRLAVIAIIMFTFPWWDSFFLFVCRINYIWSAAFILLILWISFFRKGEELSKKWVWITAPIALIAGWGHEAAGMPILAGMIYYFLFISKFKALPVLNRITIVAFAIGSVLSITSPGSYSRLGAVSTPDDPLPLLLVKSCFLSIAMLIILAGLLCIRSGRDKVRELSGTPWIILVIGAVSSILFVAVGGVVGRSGFFSQVYALVALAILLRKLVGSERLVASPSVGVIVGTILFIIMSAHEIGVCSYQLKANQEMRHCLELYMNSSDGIVYASPRQRNQFPWWTLGKNKGCIDNDDYWLVKVYDLNLGYGKKHYRLLPPELKDFNATSLPFNLEKQDGFVVAEKPEGTDDRNLFCLNGRQYTVVEFPSKAGKTLFYISPRIVDPGDR